MSASIIAVLVSTVGGAVGAALGWVVLNFVGSPVRRFFDLREEVIRRVTEFSNVRARWKQARDGDLLTADIEPNTILYGDDVRLTEAQSTLRDLASRVRAFAENERLAMWMILRLGYDPGKASQGLFGLSNTFDTYGPDKHSHIKVIEAALRCRL